MEPELAPPPSAKTPDPGWALDEFRLAFPLLLSSSVRLLPPTESFAFLCPKLLLYLCGGPGFGELDIEGASAALDETREGTDPCGPRLEGALASAKAARGDAFPNDPRGTELIDCSACEGEADNDGLLKGMKDTDGLLPTPAPPSAERRDDLDPCADRIFGGALLDSVSSGDSEPAIRAARRADNGLELVGGPGWWNVDILP